MTYALSVGRKAVALALAALLACASWWQAPALAWADDLDDAQTAVDDAQAVLDEATLHMSQIASDYDSLSAEVVRLQEQIDATAVEVLAAQDAMLKGRESLGQAASYEYRSGSAWALISLVLDAESFTELLRNVDYLGQIMSYQASEVEAQRERKEALEELSRKISAQKDEQERVLAELDEKRAQAEAVVSDATSKLAGAQDEYASQLAALQAQAAAFAQESQESGVEIADNATTVNRVDAVPDSTPVQPDPAASGANGGLSAGGEQAGGALGAGSEGVGGSGDAESGWLVGVASAYGGSSDPYTPNPGITATGAVCDDSSMGVAVPMSLPNYRSYFGRTVEISYGGMTVYAVVNDCGSMGGGSRALDLQPGVVKAFGFGDCYAWGLRTVSYRFL